MSLSIYFKNTDDQEVHAPDSLRFTINNYSKTAQGGNNEASITAYGEESDLWELVDMLRYEAVIQHDNLGDVWNGFIHSVEVRIGALVFGATLENMYNTVKVAYNNFDERRDATVAQDTRSINVFGSKEILIPISDVGDEEAAQRRDTILEESKYPHPTVMFSGDATGSHSAQIICRGWKDLFNWNYYKQTTGLEQHASGGSGTQQFGLRLVSDGLYFDDDGEKVLDQDNGLSSFKKGERVVVTNSTRNDGLYTVRTTSSDGSEISMEEVILAEAVGTSTSTTLVSACRLAQSFIQNSGSSWNAHIIAIRIKRVKPKK